MNQSNDTFVIRFQGDLNDLLPPDQRERTIALAADAHTTVKHTIESLGVPHPEVEAIVASGVAVDFGYIPAAGEQVEVYSLGSKPAVEPRIALRPPLEPPIRFVLDTHLGQLATWLRQFGFDTLYSNGYDDSELAQISSHENRLLLTRDRGLLKYKIVVYGHCVRSSEPRQQLIDILRRYHLQDQIQLWQRCVHCNGLLETVTKAEIFDQLEPKTQLYYDDFQRCTVCAQIYWRGSHFERMEAFVEEVMRELGEQR
ncbi:MAG: Mut7-C RNAse domain-containing protein [Caldilineaceae bacterium]